MSNTTPGAPLTYLGILCACYVFPFLYSLIHRRFLRKYSYRPFNPTVILAAIPFVLWDILFTHIGVWDFNPLYTSGRKIFRLPVEEYLFFLLIPQSCLLVWVAFQRYSKRGQFTEDIRQHFRKDG